MRKPLNSLYAEDNFVIHYSMILCLHNKMYCIVNHRNVARDQESEKTWFAMLSIEELPMTNPLYVRIHM